MEGPLVGIADGDAVGALVGFSIRKSIGSLVGNAEGYDVGASVGFSVGGVLGVLDGLLLVMLRVHLCDVPQYLVMGMTWNEDAKI